MAVRGQSSGEGRPVKWGPTPLGRALLSASKPLLGRLGWARTEVFDHWSEIVGPELARRCAPVRLIAPKGRSAGKVGATLMLRVSGGAAAMELQHLAPLILQRVNGHLGYAAVADLALRRGAPPRVRRRPPPRRPAPLPPALAEKLARVGDANLRATLERLGGLVAARAGEGRA